MKSSLLKRLNNDDALQGDASALAASLAMHIEDLLNVRAGSCLTRRDLGLPLIAPVQLQNDIQQSQRLAKAIEQQVAHFEPRLQQPCVRTDAAENGRLLFSLNGFFEQVYEYWQVCFRIQIDSDSRVGVRCISLKAGGHSSRLQR